MRVHESDLNLDPIPIRRGCEAKRCACLGTCETIIGWITKSEYENIKSMNLSFREGYLKLNESNPLHPSR